jgi:hypothetical protein
MSLTIGIRLGPNEVIAPFVSLGIADRPIDDLVTVW